MKPRAFAILALCLSLAAQSAAVGAATYATGKVRFEAVDVVVDSGETALAAYQFELVTLSGDVTIVGVEGGEHKAFSEPPYYDPKALTMDRVIIAAFSTQGDLPSGATRVARIHVRVAGSMEPEYEVRLTTAGGADGRKITAAASISQGEEK